MKYFLISLIFFSFAILLAVDIDKEVLNETIKKRLNFENILLLPSVHGGDNKVFFIKQDDHIIGVAKCYTKRKMHEVELIYCLSNLSKGLPLAKVKDIFLFEDTIPIVIQDFLTGEHFLNLANEQMEALVDCMVKINQVEPSLENVKSLNEFDHDVLFELCKSFPHFNIIREIYDAIDQEYLSTLPICLIHGDISGSNVLFKDNKITGIIDFDHVRFSYRLTDIARAQVFFSFLEDSVNEERIRSFIKHYQKHIKLQAQELACFYDHLKLLLIKMILETYYYVEIKREIQQDIFNKSQFNQSWQSLLKKLYCISNKKALVL